MTAHLPAFRLGDVRGIYPTDIDYDFAFAFAQAFTVQFSVKGTVAVGRDMRDSSLVLQDGLQRGFIAAGLDVVDLGLCATELGCFASTLKDIEAVVVVTASHNPEQYNGFKCVLSNGLGVHFDNGLRAVMELMQKGYRHRVDRQGQISARDYRSEYVTFLRSRFSIDQSKVGHIALNGLNGTASTIAAEVADQFELSTEWFRKQPGPFPKGGADPANPKRRLEMTEFMSTSNFDLGVAWDGDSDRCVFFDSRGQCIPAYYMVGLLADHILARTGPAAIVYDAKLCWNLLDVVNQHGATPVPSKTGHAFMKHKMREAGAVYGGELSAHHYFGDFFYCDSGMFAWLKVMELVAGLDRPIEELVADRRRKFKCCPELSLKLTDVDKALSELKRHYGAGADKIDTLDGLAFDMGSWRFSIRESKTEPCVRLNLESYESESLLVEQGESVLRRLEAYRAEEKPWISGLAVE